MESLFVVNPRKRKRKGRMPAGLRKYWASHRKTRKNPRRKRARARSRNPMHRRKHHHRARYRNPFSSSGVMSVLKPAAIGAAGAIVTSIAYGYASPSLPASLTTGYIPTVIKAAAAIGLGMLVGKFMSRQDGQYAAIGGLTVVLVGAVTPLISSAAPSLPGLSGLAGYGDYVPQSTMMNKLGAYAPGLARGTTSRFGRLGWVSPAPKLGAYMGRSMAAAGGGLSGSGFNGLNDGM